MITDERRAYAEKRISRLFALLQEIECDIRMAKERNRFFDLGFLQKRRRSTVTALNRWKKIIGEEK